MVFVDSCEYKIYKTKLENLRLQMINGCNIFLVKN